MVKVVIVNGFPGSGKSSFEKECVRALQEKKIGVGVIRSSVDFVKEVAKFCGWDGEKTPKNRKFLSDLKALLTEWRDVPFQKIVQEAMILSEEKQKYIMFVDCREPKEIDKLKKRLNAFTILVRRPEVEGEIASNESDANVFESDYDLVVWNELGIEELSFMAEYFIDRHLDEVKEYEYDY